MHLCQDKKKASNKFYAVKVIKKTVLMKEKIYKRLESEVDILKSVSHPFIIHLFWVCQDINSIYMVMQYCVGGELFNRLRRAQRFAEEECKFYSGEIALALDYLHRVVSLVIYIYCIGTVDLIYPLSSCGLFFAPSIM